MGPKKALKGLLSTTTSYWLIRLFGKGNAYRKISFEKEAYNNQDDVTYLTKRKKYNWLKEL